jgi:predicted O-methyltransferase YrrM
MKRLYFDKKVMLKDRNGFKAPIFASMLFEYLNYRMSIKRQNAIQSPFIQQFYSQVIADVHRSIDPEIESLRRQLKNNHQKIIVNDLGAGSRISKSNQRNIRSIAKHAAMSPKQGQLLSQLIKTYQLKEILELGTSLGIGTAYLSGQTNSVSVTSIEGCQNIARLAKKNLEQLNRKNVFIKVGDFDKVWDELGEQKYDLIYLDGNHREKPTMRYFNRAVDQLKGKGFIVVDDIRWSKEMKNAWEIMKRDERLNMSIDFFRFGILTHVPDEQKKHFTLKY